MKWSSFVRAHLNSLKSEILKKRIKKYILQIWITTKDFSIDFGVKVGDTVKIMNYLRGPDCIARVLHVEDIDTINFLGIDRKRIKVYDKKALDQTDYWIEGIGSIKGFLTPSPNEVDGFSELLCVYENGNQIYENKNRLTCFLD